MATDVDIVNQALHRIGVKALIDSLTEDSTEAEVAAVVYPLTRDLLLSAFGWSFATKRAVLAIATDVERSGWTYAYVLPTGCLQARGIWSGDRNAPVNSRIAYTLEANDTDSGSVLLTDWEDAELIYTSRVTTTGIFPPAFTNALSWALAAEFALSLAVKPELARALLPVAESALQKAMVADLRQRQADVLPEAEAITIRG